MATESVTPAPVRLGSSEVAPARATQDRIDIPEFAPSLLPDGSLGKGVSDVVIDRGEDNDTSRLEASHDGYVKGFGLIHQRLWAMLESHQGFASLVKLGNRRRDFFARGDTFYVLAVPRLPRGEDTSATNRSTSRSRGVSTGTSSRTPTGLVTACTRAASSSSSIPSRTKTGVQPKGWK